MGKERRGDGWSGVEGKEKKRKEREKKMNRKLTNERVKRKCEKRR
jgi:hypothetical protein